MPPSHSFLLNLNLILSCKAIAAMKVAVVGAGISGVVAGLEITVFERNDAAGGVW